MPRGVQTARRANESRRRELLMRDSDDQVYGVVTAVLGNGRFSVELVGDDMPPPRAVMQCRVRGKMRRREWVNSGDVVLVARREFDDDKGDIITRYLPHEVAQLKKYGELPDVIHKDGEDDGADDIVFEDIDAI